MHKVVYSERAKKDLLEIKSFIEQDNDFYADKTMEVITWLIISIRFFIK